MHLRERAPDDLGALTGLAARVRAEDGYPVYLRDDDFVRFLSRPEPLGAWVAEIGGAVVGQVALNAETSSPVMQLVRDAAVDGDLAFVARLLVDPSARRRGVGTRLLEHARLQAIARGRVPLLDVVVTAHGAISLYRGAGWREIGRSVLSLPGGREIEQLVFLGSDE